MPHDYLIEALAPLVFRSGKPFGSQAGADGAAFPLPSSLAGLVRTLYADQHKQGFSDALRQITVAGPLLARREADGSIVPLLPKPNDALYLKDGAGSCVIRLAPAPLPPGAGCDLPEALMPVQMTRSLDGKPVVGPQFWPLERVIEWSAGAEQDFHQLEVEGLGSLATEDRTHVALDRKTYAADDGRLFQTGGIELTACQDKQGWESHDLVFLGRGEVKLASTLATFGGERRLSRLHAADTGHYWPAPPHELDAQIRAAKGLRLTLATPAIFSAGHLPGWLDAQTLSGEPPACPGLSLRLRAAAIERWLPVSGWDLATNKARAMRKAVAPGAVYWFELLGDPPSGFLDQLWLRPVSDHTQDRHDGFGLALPAAWLPPAHQ